MSDYDLRERLEGARAAGLTGESSEKLPKEFLATQPRPRGCSTVRCKLRSSFAGLAKSI